MQTSTTRDDALAKRRAQNREAQRRFRWKQSQQKEKATATIEPLREEHADINIINPRPPILDPPTPAGLPIPMPAAHETKRPNECIFSSGLSLFGNYALLDNFDMEDFHENALTTSSIDMTSTASSLSSTLYSDESPFVATTHHTPLSQYRPSYSRHNSKDAIQTISSDRSSHPRRSSRAASCTTNDTPMSDSNSHSVDLSSSSDSPFIDETATRPTDTRGPGWQSPLHMAAGKGHDRIVRILLQHQSDCNERDSDGLTPLFHACIGGHEHIVALLHEHGARLSEKDNEGRTVLHLAVVHRQEALLKTLLQCSASDHVLIDSYDSAGRTALHTAVEMGFEAGVRILLEHGANLNYRARKA